MSFDAAGLWAALGFVVGVAGGGAVAARIAGRPALAGRRCPKCAASLSPWSRLPALSWFGARSRCPRCANPLPRLNAAVELAVVAAGVAAILVLPLRLAVLAAALAWGVILLLVLRRR